MAIPTRAELDALVRQRIAEDPAFRDVLLAAPRAAVSELVGVPLPDFVTVTIHEESLTDVHLVIPPDATGEIAEDDLELAAGGIDWSGPCGP